MNTSNQSLTPADAEENEYDPVSSLFTPLIMRSTLVSREKDGAMMAYKVTMLKVTFAVKVHYKTPLKFFLSSTCYEILEQRERDLFCMCS